MSVTPSGANPPVIRSNRAVYSPAAWILLTMVLFLGLAFDLGSKWWSFNHVADRPVTIAMLKHDPEGSIPPHNGVHVLPWSLLDLRLVVNHGAVFGIAPNKRLFLLCSRLVPWPRVCWSLDDSPPQIAGWRTSPLA